jgi:hypothetical protein
MSTFCRSLLHPQTSMLDSIRDPRLPCWIFLAVNPMTDHVEQTEPTDGLRRRTVNGIPSLVPRDGSSPANCPYKRRSGDLSSVAMGKCSARLTYSAPHATSVPSARDPHSGTLGHTSKAMVSSLTVSGSMFLTISLLFSQCFLYELAEQY